MKATDETCVKRTKLRHRVKTENKCLFRFENLDIKGRYSLIRSELKQASGE